MTDDKKQAEPEDFGLINARDEAQILAELAGVPVLDFVYINKRGQAELTYAGTKWAVRELAQRGEAIRVTHDPKVERCPIDPEYICVTIRGARFKVDREAKCETMLDTSVGAARNWKNQLLADKKTVISDENFFKKAIGIATRNAMQSLLPQDFLKEMIDILADKRRALERGEKQPAKAKAAAPAKQPDAAPSAQQAAASPTPAQTAQTAQQAAKPADAPAPATPPAKQGEKTIRQKLFVALNHFEKDTAAKRKLLLELTGKDSSKDLADLDVTRLTAALERSLPGKVNELRANADGSRYIFEKPTLNILHGKTSGTAAATAAAAPAGAPGAEEEPF